VGIIVSVLGIVNVVASWKVSNDLSSEAHKVAVAKVQTSVEEEVARQSKNFARITDEAETGIADFRKEYKNIFEQIGSANTKLKHLQSTEQEIEKGFLELTTKSKELGSQRHSLRLILTVRSPWSP
jgi:hypothetical protein